MALKSTTDVVVREHRDKEKSGKEAVYTVVMETAPTHNPQMRITLTSEIDIRQDFPLNEVYAISISNPQTKLET